MIRPPLLAAAIALSLAAPAQARDARLSSRLYNPDEVVLGKRMEDHLRFAVAWWHSFAWPGGDPFGGQTFERPWFGDGTRRAPGSQPSSGSGSAAMVSAPAG